MYIYLMYLLWYIWSITSHSNNRNNSSNLEHNVCGLETPYGNIYIWVNIGSDNGLLPDQPHAINWTNVDFSLVRLCDIHLSHLRAISQ